MITPPPSPCRRGTILIVVSGISALMASLALAFLVNAQADSRESELQIRDGQARIMLVAACSYLLEASRIGWEPMKPTDPSGSRAPEPASTEHVEAFGWIDVRDGSLGPHINTVAITDGDRWASRDANNNLYPVNQTMVPNPFPVGVPARFPMHVLNRPPFAISPRVAMNPIDPAVAQTQHLQNRDPWPADTDPNEWAKGETYPGVGPDGKLQYKVRQNSIGQSWFRILREKSGASFIVTCGAGGSLGYRDWTEVGADQSYFGDRSIFEAIRESEIRLWYRVEWNAAVVAMEMNYLREGMEHAWKLSSFSYSGGGHDMGDSGPTVKDLPNRGNYSSQWMSANMGGSIQYIQRLRQEPTAW